MTEAFPLPKGSTDSCISRQGRVESARGAQRSQIPVLQVQQTRTSTRFCTVWWTLSQSSDKKGEGWQEETETEAISILIASLMLPGLCSQPLAPVRGRVLSSGISSIFFLLTEWSIISKCLQKKKKRIQKALWGSFRDWKISEENQTNFRLTSVDLRWTVALWNVYRFLNVSKYKKRQVK